MFGTAQRSLPIDPGSGIATARSVGETVTAKAELKFSTRITVSCGHLVVTDAQTGEILGEGTKLRVHGDVIICWHLEEGEQKGKLTLSALGTKTSYKAENGQLIRTK